MVDLFLFELGVVFFYEFEYFWSGDGSVIVHQFSCVGEYFIEIVKFWSGGGQGDRTETVLEMGEHVGYCVLVGNFDEVDLRVDAVVEAVEVEEVDGVGVVAVV